MRRSSRRMWVDSILLLIDWMDWNVLTRSTRSTTTLSAMATGTAISSSTRRTGIWPRASPWTDCTVCHTAISQGSARRNTLRDNRNDGKRSCLEIPSRTSTPSPTSIRINCSRGAHRAFGWDVLFLRRMRRIFAIHCECTYIPLVIYH